MVMDKPETTTEELMSIIAGPDFPGGIIIGREEFKVHMNLGKAK